jgi:hypothetical protein
MIRETMRELGGIGIYGIVSMVLFVAIFLGALVWSLVLKKPHLTHMSHLPLEPDDRPSEGEPNHD